MQHQQHAGNSAVGLGDDEDDDDDNAAMDEMKCFDDTTPRKQNKMRNKNEVLSQVVKKQVEMMRFMRSKQGAKAQKDEQMSMAAHIKQSRHEQHMYAKMQLAEGIAICNAILKHLHERRVVEHEDLDWATLLARVTQEHNEATKASSNEPEAAATPEHEEATPSMSEYFDWDKLGAAEAATNQHEANATLRSNEFFDWNELEKSIKKERNTKLFMRSTAQVDLHQKSKADEVKDRRKLQRKQSKEDFQSMKSMRKTKMKQAWLH